MKNEHPLVSVILAAYNAEKFISLAIQSVLEQTYPHWELLITNDGSTDGTSTVLSSFTDKRITIFSQPNKGVSAARNTALQHMKGKYFTFLDADDTLPKESLAIRINYLENNAHASILAGSVAFFNSEGPQKKWTPHFNGNPLPHFVRLDEKVFCNPSLVFRVRPGIHYSFKEGMTHVEDLLFYTTIVSQQEHDYHSIDRVIYNYRLSEGTAMANLSGLENGYWTFYESVKHLPNVLQVDVRYLKKRIVRIMARSYLGAGRVTDALLVLGKLLSTN
jgi:glycosyltransferase involved in cell wall biosynthesis